MPFKQGAFCTVWGVSAGRTANTTTVKLSSVRKNKDTGAYEQDFSGFCTFIGNAHKLAPGLAERDRIRLGECEVSNRYNKETKTEYVNYKVFDFEIVSQDGKTQTTRQAAAVAQAAAPKAPATAAAPTEEGPESDDDLPF